MPRTLVRLAVLAALVTSADAASAQFIAKYESIAITEFMSRPIGESRGRQWVELYNFGDEPVKLKSFQFYDEGNKLCDFPDVTIQPKDFVIIVLGHYWHHSYTDDELAKKIFEAEWLGGKVDPRVVAIRSHYSLGASDTLILRNLRRTPIWILGWKADGKPGNSTFLAIDDFRIRMYGTKEKPAINRTGPDGQTLGYEDQDATKDPFAYTSDVSKLEEIGGVMYKTAEAGGNVRPGKGSPLKGNYPGAKN
jgi:hypothetical protein